MSRGYTDPPVSWEPDFGVFRKNPKCRPHEPEAPHPGLCLPLLTLDTSLLCKSDFIFGRI